MRVLVVKTSSMGDVIHALPALTDAGSVLPGICFDWVVEKPFAEIPRWHPLVDRVLPVAVRQWRKAPFAKKTREEFRTFCHALREREYDCIIDAQGLIKSALLMRLARVSQGLRYGFDRASARESFASLFYPRTVAVSRKLHAIVRLRQLFAHALGYSVPDSPPGYGIDRQVLAGTQVGSDYLVFLHGTTWATKLWPESHWITLANLAAAAGYRVKMGSGNDEECARVQRLAAQSPAIEIVPPQTLAGMAQLLAGARGVVAVDTGLGHLTAALSVPAVSLYGPTSPALSGALGAVQQHLFADFPACAPCFARVCSYKGSLRVDAAGHALLPACLASISPVQVWATLAGMMA